MKHDNRTFRILAVLFLIFFFISVFCSSIIAAQFSSGELIGAFEYAVQTDNRKNIAVIKKAIEEDQTTLNYIMANRPDLYEVMTAEDASLSDSVLISGGEVLADDETGPEDDLQTRVDLQKQRAAESVKRLEDHLKGELEKRTITMIVSGVGRDERQQLINIIKNELSMVKFVREKRYKNSQVEYQIELKDISLDKFAYAFDNRRFGRFSLDLVGMSSMQVEFVLKQN